MVPTTDKAAVVIVLDVSLAITTTLAILIREPGARLTVIVLDVSLVSGVARVRVDAVHLAVLEQAG